MDYDFEEHWSVPAYCWNKWNKDFNERTRLTKEDIRKDIDTDMTERVEERNWVYSYETEKWYATNEIMDEPKGGGLMSNYCKFKVKIDTDSYPKCEDMFIRNYIRSNTENLNCILKIKNGSFHIANIRFDYRKRKEIEKMLQKVEKGEYSRLFITEYPSVRMHIWVHDFDNSKDEKSYLHIVGLDEDDDKELFSFQIDTKSFTEGVLWAMNEIEHKVKVMEKVLASADELNVPSIFKINEVYHIKKLDTFIGDYACVKIKYGNGYGIIGKDLNWVVEPKKVTMSGKEHPKLGHETLGSFVKYKYLENIDGKLFIATGDNKKKFVVDIEEKLAIPHVSDEIYYTYFNNELYFAAVDYNKTYIVNSKGEDVLILDYPIGSRFWLDKDVIILSKDEKFGIIDWQGNKVIDFIFSDIKVNLSNSDFIPVKYMNAWGLITKTSDIIDLRKICKTIK